MDLEDLMNVKIVSASKKSESLFDAPLSASSIGREEIKKSGATSIVDALRLVPGLIVRETTNGNAEVFIRGFDNLPPGTVLSNATNSITLVMIDNRPVYNYFNGGTFWESLPVDLNDVEQIEVVRGPSSALYGPNAANGVINILTRKLQKEGVYAVANGQGGTTNTYLGNTSLGYKKGKWDVIVSGNFQSRQRFENQYYSWTKDAKMEAEGITTSFPGEVLTDVNRVPNANERYPNRSQALQRYGYNSFVNYVHNDKTSLGLSVGGQQSAAQVAFVENLATPLSYRLSNSYYADLKAKVHGFTSQVAYQKGSQDVSKGQNGYKYDFSTLDALIEYDLNIHRFTFKPGVNFRTALYDDRAYANVENKEGFLNGAQTLDNVSGSLRVEYNDLKRWKFIGAIRFDQYNYPKQVYCSYQFASNFKVNEQNLIRLVYSRAFRGPNMYDTYSSQNLYVGDLKGAVPIHSYAPYYGNKELKLQQVDMAELGYRLKATERLHFDLEAFYQLSSNFAQFQGGKQTPPAMAPDLSYATVVIPQRIQNIRMKAEQIGFTLSSNLLYKKFQFKPFATVQQTYLQEVPQVRDSANILKRTDSDYSNSHAPTWYGGASLNYQVTSKWNVNLTGYYYSPYSYRNIYYFFQGTKQNGTVAISDKLLLNARVAYKLLPQLDVFVNVRNALNAQTQEFAHTDITQSIYLLGANFEW